MSALAFSVVIPGFNRLEPLKYTLRSVAAAAALMPRDSVEIILVDDGSAPSLQEQLAGFDPGHTVVHIRQKNQGSIVARLTGLASARGSRVLFLDSDDLIAPQKLIRHHETGLREHADIIYDDMARAELGPDHSCEYFPGDTLARVHCPVNLFLRVQPLPHVATFDRDFLVRALAPPLIPPERRMDPSGDVWLYCNLVPFPASVAKIDAPLSAVGPHEELRYSRHWEKLGAASLLIAEAFQKNRPATGSGLAAGIAVGEAAFQAWRRLPFDYPPVYRRRIIAVWKNSPRGPVSALGGRTFCFFARVLGPLAAGWLYRRIFGRRYAVSRTLGVQEFQRLLAEHEM